MIYINARFLTQDLTGVQRFAESISISLSKIRNDLVFVSPDNIKRKDVAEQLNVKVVGNHTGHYWEQIELPGFLKSNDNPLLVNLGNTSPVRYNNKISTLHDITYKKYPKSYSLKFRLLYDIIIPRVLKTSSALITVSDFSKKKFRTFTITRKKIFTLFTMLLVRSLKKQVHLMNSLFSWRYRQIIITKISMD
ncbi:hypothetical protein SMQE32_09320 [Serratia marcescens]|nr:hypothetical protein SMQE32_09320 [Serratia marcescens]